MTSERPHDATSDPGVAPAVETAPSPRVPRVALILVGIAAAVLLLRYTREVLIPFGLAGLLFYELDPVVDWMQKWRIPRALGAFAAIMVVLCGAGGLAYSLQDDFAATINELPRGARQLSTPLQREPSAKPGAMEAVQEAADELKIKSSPAPLSAGVMRVEIQEPAFQART